MLLVMPHIWITDFAAHIAIFQLRFSCLKMYIIEIPWVLLACCNRMIKHVAYVSYVYIICNVLGMTLNCIHISLSLVAFCTDVS